MNKIPIGEGQFKGNLKELTQEYRINYMPKEEQYEPKLELAILLTKDGEAKKAYRSIRFTNSAQIKSFILSMIKGYFYFARVNNEINQNNFRYKLNKFWDDILKGLRTEY